MKILKRLFGWLFGKYPGYTKKEVEMFEPEDFPEPHTEQSIETPIKKVDEVLMDKIRDERKKKTWKKPEIANCKKLWRNWHKGK